MVDETAPDVREGEALLRVDRVGMTANNVTYALLLGLGLLIGAYIGAIYAVKMPASTLRRIFGVFLLLTSIRMLYN